MSTEPQGAPSSEVTSPQTRDAIARHELAGFQGDWWWFLLLGVALVVLGTISIGSAALVSQIAAVVFGVLLLAAGIATLISAFWTGRWSGFLVHLLLGVLYVVVGMVMIDAPAEAAAALTLVIAAFLIVLGTFRLVAALAVRFPGWGWHLLAGVVSILLGMMIYEGWPATGLFIIGLFVGIELIFSGWTWIMLSLEVRRAVEGEA